MWCTKSAAERVYLTRNLVAMSIYLLVTAAVSWIFTHHPPEGAMVYVLAMAPALPIFAVIASLGKYLIEEKDEFVRTVLVQCSLWATAVALALSTCMGLLERFLPRVNRSANFQSDWIFVVWWLAFAAAQPLVRWRYK